MTRSARPAVGVAVLAMAVVAACGGNAGPALLAEPPRTASPSVMTTGPAPVRTPAGTTAGVRLDAPSPEAAVTPSSGSGSPPGGSAVTSSPYAGIALPTYGDGPVPAALMPGARVVGSPDGQCVWLLDADGRKHAALWPPGYRAAFDPLRVFNASQRPVWGEGHVQDVGGGFTSAGVERLPEQCRVGDDVWWVSELEASAPPTGAPGPK